MKCFDLWDQIEYKDTTPKFITFAILPWPPLPPPLDVKFLLLFTPFSFDPSPIIVYTWPNLINWLVEAWMIFGVDVDSKSSCMILDFVIQEEVEWLEESLCDMRRCVACKERFCDLSGYVTLVQVVWYEGSNMAFLFRIWTPPPSLLCPDVNFLPLSVLWNRAWYQI